MWDDDADRPAECERCGGAGMVTVFRRDYDGRPIVPGFDRRGNPRDTAARVAAHCVCPTGRSMRAALASSRPGLFRRIPDLALVLAGRSAWLADDPTGPVDLEDFAPGPRRAKVQEWIGTIGHHVRMEGAF